MIFAVPVCGSVCGCMAWPISFGCHCHVNFTLHSGIVIVPMDLTSGRRGVGPCSRVVMEAFVAGQEPDKDCGVETVAVSKLPYYLQRPFYQAKEAEPTQPIADASAQSGESAESPAPNVEEGPKSTTTAPPPVGSEHDTEPRFVTAYSNDCESLCKRGRFA